MKLHKVAARPVVFPCGEVISWLLQRVNVWNRLIMYIDDENTITYFHPLIYLVIDPRDTTLDTISQNCIGNITEVIVVRDPNK